MKNSLRKMYGIIFLISLFFVIPTVHANVELTDLSYATSGDDVDVIYVYGYGGSLDNFVFPKVFSYEDKDFSFIDKTLLEENDYRLNITLNYFQYDYDDSAAISNSSSWNVVARFETDEYDEVTEDYISYVIYTGTVSGSELKDGKTIELDLSEVPMNDEYDIVFNITNAASNEELSAFAGCKEDVYGKYCASYHEFFIGNKYGFDFEAKIDDTYGLSHDDFAANLGGFFDAFSSFNYSFTLTKKEDNATYNLKKYHCISAQSGSYTPSDDDTCTLIDTVENANLNTKYFNTTVTKEIYDEDLADIDYIRFTVYNGENAVTSKYYYLDEDYEAQVNFVTYSVTDATGHDVLSDYISNSKKVTVHLDGINFKENETYYVSVYPAQQEFTNDYTWEDTYTAYTGKQLNDGIDVEMEFSVLRDYIFMSVYGYCDFNYDAPGCDSSNIDSIWMEHYTDEIVVNDLTDTFKSLSVKNLTAKGIDYNKVELNFDEVDGATGYAIYRSTSKTKGYKLIGTSEVGRYIDENASVKTTYYYKVRAYNTSTGDKIYSKYSSVKSGKAVLHKPENLVVNSVNYNSIKVSYDKVDGASGYAIYRATSKTGTYKLVGTTTKTSYTDKKLTTGKTYYYKVKAYRTVSSKKYYSSYSSYQSSKPKLTAPEISATGHDYDTNKIAIKTKPAGVTGYAIYRKAANEDTYTRIATTTKTTYYDKGLETGKVYYYKVKAYRTVSGKKYYGAYSDEKMSAGVVLAPKITVDNSSSKNYIKINITKARGATGYYIFRDNIKIAETKDLTYIDENVEYGKEYTYSVAGYRTAGGYDNRGVMSERVTAMVKPAIPTITIKNTKYNQQLVTLNTSEIGESDNYTYYLYRSTSKTKDFELVYEGQDSVVEMNDLAFNKTYYYKVVIKLNDVESNKSDAVGKKTSLVAPVSRANYSSKTSIKVSWDKVDGATGYQVYRATSKTGKYTLISTTTKTSYTNTKLTTGKRYYYKVRAYKTVSGKKVYGSYSSVVSDVPKVGIPTFKVNFSSATSNKIVITKVSGATGYAIYRSETEDGEYTLVSTTTKTSYTDKNLETGKTYYYKIKAYALVGKTKKYGDYSIVLSSTPTEEITVE